MPPLVSLAQNTLPVAFGPAKVPNVASQPASDFPSFFSGLLDSGVFDSDPLAAANNDPPLTPIPIKERKQPAPNIAVANNIPPAPAPLPFVLNLQMPQPTQPASAPQAATTPLLTVLSNHQATEQPQKKQAAAAAGDPGQTTAPMLIVAPDLPFVPAPDDSKNSQSDETKIPAAALPSPIPELPTEAKSPAAPQAAVVETALRNHPEPPAAPVAGSPWKQTTTPLPHTELAFAARVLPARGPTEPQPRKESDTTTGPRAPQTTRVTTPDRQADTDSQQRQPDSNPEPSPIHALQRTSAPTLPRPTPSEPEREVQPSPAPKETVTLSAPTPVIDTSQSSSPTRSPERSQPVSHTSETQLPEVRVSEAQATAPAPPIRDFSLRLTGPDQDKVEVKVVESAGEIRVAVRSADPVLNTSLQQGIGELVGKLESHGMNAETWKPAESTTTAAQSARTETSQNNQQQFTDSGSQERQSRQQQSPQNRRRNKPEWLQEIDGTFDTLHSDIVRRTA